MKKLATASALSLSLIVSGCASNGGIMTSHSGGCDTGMSSAMGALLGAAAGYAVSKNNNNSSAQNNRAIALGAAAGGAIGGGVCVMINARTVQTQTASQVKQEYLQKHGELPTKTAIETYNVTLNPSKNVVSANEKIMLQSDLKVIEGQNDPLKTIQETFILRNEDGKALNTVTKNVTQTGTYDSGSFENSFTFALPHNVSKGTYTLETELLVNGKKVANNVKKLTLI